MGRIRFTRSVATGGVAVTAAIVVALAACNDLGDPPKTYAMPGDAIFSGDIDGDGDADLMTGGGDGYDFALNDGTGNFTPAYVDGHSDFSHMVLADVNSDNRQDMINLIYSGGDPDNGIPESYHLETKLSNGDGTFDDATMVGQTGLPPDDHGSIAITAANVNGDAWTDVVLYKSGTGITASVSVFLGSGANSFLAPVVTPTSTKIFRAGMLGHAGMAVADMNRDGKRDLIVTGWGDWPGDEYSRGQIAVLDGNGTGGFTATHSYATPAGVASRAVGPGIGDFNEDGRLDVVTADVLDAGGGPESLTFWFGQANGLLGTGVSRAAKGETDTDLAVADVNGDHHLDVVTVAHKSNDDLDGSAWLMEGDGAGNISTTAQLAAPTGYNGQHGGIVVRDLSGDGKPEVAVSNGIDKATVFPNAMGG
jgi:hypothetical protein